MNIKIYKDAYIQMSYYQYVESKYKDKTISRRS